MKPRFCRGWGVCILLAAGFATSSSAQQVILGGSTPAVDGQVYWVDAQGILRPWPPGATATLTRATPTTRSVRALPSDSREAPAGQCEPAFTNQATFELPGDSAFFLTHFSRRLDAALVTQPGLNRLVQTAKDVDAPILYLHEPVTTSVDYFYPHCEPHAYIRSEIGHFEFSSGSLKHAVVAGGFYEMCLNNTVKQLIQNWQANAGRRELKVTYVTDAVYCVAEDRQFSDPFDVALSRFIQQQPSTTILLSDVLEQLVTREAAWTFLSRRWGKVPAPWGLTVRLRGEDSVVRTAAAGQPTLTIEYLKTTELSAENNEP